MRQGGKSSVTTKSAQEQFRTPDKPPLPGCSTTSKARKDISTTKRQSGTPVSSGSTSKSWKRSLLSGEQPTLTQIDFVTPRSQNLESNDDDDLDYLGDAPHNETPVNRQVIDLDDGSDGDTIYKPNAHSRLRRSVGAMDGQNAEGQASRLRRSLGQANSNEKRSQGRKSTDSVASNKKRTDKPRKDKTLTQMDYVRRYLKIEPDDEVKLEYTYITPKRNQRQTITRKNSRDLEFSSSDNAKISSSSKKRKLQYNGEEQGSKMEVISPQTQGNRPLKEEPKTPQKPKRSEIPSSQSPESPGVAFISSSQFRKATRSPPNLDDTKIPIKCIKEEIPDSNDTAESLKQMSMVENTLPPPIVPESSPSFELGDGDEVPFDAKATQLKPATETYDSALEIVRQHELDNPPPSTERTVVYETDAETEFSDDEQLIASGPRYGEIPAYAEDQEIENEDEDPENDSQILPSPIIHSNSDDEPSLLQAEINLSSDASICYQRRHPATQFPAEPVPTLSTQKLAELFPQESSLQQTPTETSRIKPSLLRNQTLVDPFLPTQTQSQTQDLDKDSTEIVLESSPVARHQEYTGVGDPTLPAHPAHGVVQVESSQPADRLKQHADQIQNSGPKGLLSRSQLLTSSVMESVPVPGFWMGSQDSIGEPYSLPDT